MNEAFPWNNRFPSTAESKRVYDRSPQRVRRARGKAIGDESARNFHEALGSGSGFDLGSDRWRRPNQFPITAGPRERRERSRGGPKSQLLLCNSRVTECSERIYEENTALGKAGASPRWAGRKGVIDFISTSATIPSHLSEQLIHPFPPGGAVLGYLPPADPAAENVKSALFPSQMSPGANGAKERQMRSAANSV